LAVLDKPTVYVKCLTCHLFVGQLKAESDVVSKEVSQLFSWADVSLHF